MSNDTRDFGQNNCNGAPSGQGPTLDPEKDGHITGEKHNFSQIVGRPLHIQVQP